MIGCEHDHGVVGLPRLIQGPHDLADAAVHDRHVAVVTGAQGSPITFRMKLLVFSVTVQVIGGPHPAEQREIPGRFLEKVWPDGQVLWVVEIVQRSVIGRVRLEHHHVQDEGAVRVLLFANEVGGIVTEEGGHGVFFR